MFRKKFQHKRFIDATYDSNVLYEIIMP